MAGPINIVLCSPERPETQLDASEVILPGAGGVFTVQADHTPVLTNLIPGVLEITVGEGERVYSAVNGGFAEIKENTVRVLAELLEEGSEIELERAKLARERAEKRLLKITEDLDVERAESALKRAIARIDAHSGQGY